LTHTIDTILDRTLKQFVEFLQSRRDSVIG